MVGDEDTLPGEMMKQSYKYVQCAVILYLVHIKLCYCNYQNNPVCIPWLQLQCNCMHTQGLLQLVEDGTLYIFVARTSSAGFPSLEGNGFTCKVA